MNTTNPLRWKQRFQNFEKAFILLKGTFDEKAPAMLSDLEREGVIQRFKFTFELAWKTLKDYLENEGVIFEQITPRQVIKQAFSSKIIHEGELWIDMLTDRNLMTHTYDQKKFEKVILSISEKYIDALNTVYTLLKEKSLY